MTTQHDYHCLRCDRDFTSKSETPAACPHCKSYYWDEPSVHYERFSQRAVQVPDAPDDNEGEDS